MKYVLTGSAGNITTPLTFRLLEAGHDVTVVGRSEEKMRKLSDKGASLSVGDLLDTEFLAKTFKGADAVYTLIPPNNEVTDFRAYQRETADSIVSAITRSGVRNVINLSSVGADLKDKVGPVSMLNYMESKLSSLEEVNVLNLRPGYFMQNLYAQIPVVKNFSIFGSNSGPDTKIAFVHVTDIAQVAADELIRLSFKGHSHTYVVGDERTLAEVADILSSAIGKPGIPWVQLPDEQFRQGLVQAGLSESISAEYTEMGVALRDNSMLAHYFANKPPALQNTKVEDFAREFAAAFNAS